MGKYQPPRQYSLTESLAESKADFDKKYKLIATEWWIKEEHWQRDDYCGGHEKTSERFLYGPYETKEEAQEHVDLLEADETKKRFGHRYFAVQRRCYEYTTTMWV